MNNIIKNHNVIISGLLTMAPQFSGTFFLYALYIICKYFCYTQVTKYVNIIYNISAYNFNFDTNKFNV